MIPPVQQRSVDELIERNIVLHQRGMDEIWLRFRNTVIVKALQICDGNASHAAIMLKIHRNTLGRWMRQANIVRGNGGVE
jgi:DNA-binding NtrC family response regulator